MDARARRSWGAGQDRGVVPSACAVGTPPHPVKPPQSPGLQRASFLSAVARDSSVGAFHFGAEALGASTQGRGRLEAQLGRAVGRVGARSKPPRGMGNRLDMWARRRLLPRALPVAMACAPRLGIMIRQRFGLSRSGRETDRPALRQSVDELPSGTGRQRLIGRLLDEVCLKVYVGAGGPPTAEGLSFGGARCRGSASPPVLVIICKSETETPLPITDAAYRSADDQTTSGRPRGDDRLDAIEIISTETCRPVRATCRLAPPGRTDCPLPSRAVVVPVPG